MQANSASYPQQDMANEYWYWPRGRQSSVAEKVTCGTVGWVTQSTSASRNLRHANKTFLQDPDHL